MHSELQSHVVSYRRVLHEREVQREQVSQSFPNLEHNEAQLRVQLQAKEVISSSLNEGFHASSEKKRQSVINAQEGAPSCRSEMSQEITACDWWKSEVTRLTKEVAEQNTMRQAGGNSWHYSSIHLTPPGKDCSQLFHAVRKS